MKGVSYDHSYYPDYKIILHPSGRKSIIDSLLYCEMNYDFFQYCTVSMKGNVHDLEIVIHSRVKNVMQVHSVSKEMHLFFMDFSWSPGSMDGKDLGHL